MKKQKLISKGPYLVDELYRGELTDRSTAIVMDNTFSRQHNNKRKVSYFITENTDLLAGQSTVALFIIKKRLSEQELAEEGLGALAD